MFVPEDFHVTGVTQTSGQVRDPLLVKYLPWIVIAGVIVFVLAIRIRLLQIPLERNEGEYAYMGQLMLQGIPPYLLAYNMKLPFCSHVAFSITLPLWRQQAMRCFL